MAQKIVIIDYHMGNIHSVVRKLSKIGIEVLVSQDPNDILKAEKLVFPGVGHFGEAMRSLKSLNLIDALNEAVLIKKTPILGICLGMQCAVIEFARNVLGLEGAHSTEINPKAKHPVIDLMEEQKSVTEKGGTMRLGSYGCELLHGSESWKCYRKEEVAERHRHRYACLTQTIQYRHQFTCPLSI